MRLIRVRGRRAGAYSDHFLDDGPLRAVRQGLPEGLEMRGLGSREPLSASCPEPCDPDPLRLPPSEKLVHAHGRLVSLRTGER